MDDIFSKLKLDNKTELKLKKCLLCEDDPTDELFNERLKELKQRRRFRNLMFWAFFLLLLMQYIALGLFMLDATNKGYIVQIQVLLSIIIPSTLGETWAIHKTMVNYVFSPGDYTNTNKK